MAPEPSRAAPDAAEPVAGAPPDALTRLLEDLARTPDSDPGEAWQRPLSPGDVVGRFELVREAGRGGFGVVYEARDHELGRAVAFKALRPGHALTPAQVAGLRAEAEAAAQLNHPNIVTVHDFGTCASGPYLIMELLRGEPLSQRLEREHLPVVEAVRIAREVACALVHAHAAGVVHRDLKPGNVFLREDGSVKVLDFGLARLMGATGVRGGTPGYMAPEQAQGADDARSDLFGLGALLFRMLVGEAPPEDGPSRFRAVRACTGPKKAILPALGALLEDLLAHDPGSRPAGARDVLEALDRIALEVDPVHAARSRRRRLTLVAALTVAAVSGAAAGLWMRLHEAAALEHVTVAVADFANETGDPSLEGLSSMLITSLEQSRKVGVLTRSRMRDELKKLGHADVPRIDEGLAREVGRASGAKALLLASMRRFDDTYAVEMRALDPRSDRYLFAVSEKAQGKSSIPALIDRVSERTRRELRERAEDVREERIDVAQAVTRNLEAYRHYFEGTECLDRPGERKGTLCAAHFREALDADPEFALAHFQLALVSSMVDPTAARASIEAATRHLEQVPQKERGLVLALKAHLDGKDDEALSRYREVLARYPAEKAALFQAGSLLWSRADLAGAIPYLQRALELDPSFEPAVKRLVESLGSLRRHDELRALLAAWERLPSTSSLRTGQVRALFWLGDLDGARAAAERNLEQDGPQAAIDLASIDFHAGEFAAAEATLADASRAFPQSSQARVYALWNIAAQGRVREALAQFDATFPRPALESDAYRHVVRARLLAARGDPAAVWAEIRETARTAPEQAAMLAVDLAVLGDAAHARELAPALQQRSTTSELLQAALAWRDGDVPAAKARLRALDAVAPHPQDGETLPPSFVLAEVAAAAGHDREVVEAVDRVRTVWSHMGAYGSWMMPRALFLRARSLARLGQLDEARRSLDPLLAQWRRADRDVRVVADARALRATLDPDAR